MEFLQRQAQRYPECEMGWVSRYAFGRRGASPAAWKWRSSWHRKHSVMATTLQAKLQAISLKLFTTADLIS